MFENNGINYLFDLKSKEMMHLYYAAKNRHGYSIENRDKLIKEIIIMIKPFIEKYDFIIYPQSSNDFLEKIITGLNKTKIMIEKHSIESLLGQIENLKLQKAEKISHMDRISNMNGSFKINALKATQRKKYEDILFKEIEIPSGNGVIIDDSCFSGTTFNAIKGKANVQNCLAIFAK